MRVYAYCDGAVKGNGKKGRIGMGAVLNYFSGLEIVRTTTHSGGMDCDPATNNLAELMAIRHAFTVVEADPSLVYLHIHSDSEWAVKAIRGEYRVTHHLELLADIHAFGCLFDTWNIDWVKGHNDHEWNEKANELAQREAGTWKGK